MGVKASVVIATYNRCKDLSECLHSLFNLRVKPYEVIVIDSDSVDYTEKLKDHFPIRFVSIHERNRQRARNLGISIAGGDVVAFLDDDVVVSEEWMNHILESYVKEYIGGVGGRVVPYGASAGFHVKISKNDVGRVFDNGLVIGNFDIPCENAIEVDSFIGCNMSFRRELLLKVGGFDENYAGTGYRDDTDLCVRIRRLGCKLLYQPKALVWHKFRGKRLNSEWMYWYFRNHTYFYLKNFFAQSRLNFPYALYYMLFPPRDYVLKSGIELKIEPTSILYLLKGLVGGYNTWRTIQIK